MTDLNQRPYWAKLKPRRPEKVWRIREAAWRLLRPVSDYERVEPHLTVHPGFTATHRAASQTAGVLAYTVGKQFDVTGLEFYPSADEPMVVMLGLDADLAVYRQTIEHHVREGGGTIDRDPVDPHITLFKAGDAGEAPDSRLEHESPADLEGKWGDWSMEVGGFGVERRG